MCDGELHQTTDGSMDDKVSPVIPSRLSRMSTITASWCKDDDDDQHTKVSKLLKNASMVGIISYASLLFLVTYLSPPEIFEYSEGSEKAANCIVFILLFVTNGSKILPILFRSGSSNFQSGALVGCCTVQGIAMTSVAMMALFPTPVMMDEVTGMRVRLFRWVEWTVLSFMMAFLTEGVDLPEENGEFIAWTYSFSIALSTSAGFLFPLCPDIYWWSFVFFLSCVLFSPIYFRLYYRYKRYKAASAGNGVEAKELYDRVRLSYRLVLMCSIVWTILVIGFTACRVGPYFASEDSIFHDPVLEVIVENCHEVASKIWYLTVIMDIHESIFDESARALRRLEELRDMMSVVWENSSDMIALSVRSGDRTTTMLSPTFLRMPFCKDQTASSCDIDMDDQRVLVIEVIGGSISAFSINVADVVARDKPVEMSVRKGMRLSLDVVNLQNKNIVSMTQLLSKAWESETKESLLMHDLHGRSGEKDVNIRCEAKVMRLEKEAVVVILRDISERFRRFEAEKKLVIEVTARRKDAEANRFTRHEVKNGLLAAIALVDSLREASMPKLENEESFSELTVQAKKELLQIAATNNSARDGMHRSSSASSLVSLQKKDTNPFPPKFPGTMPNLKYSMEELDSTLREVLDTVLAEAMARDVIHEVYEPKMERLDICALLQGVRSGKGDIVRGTQRFPIFTSPESLPEIILDPQLLRYIHRNAVSNACKYGEPGAPVRTEIIFNARKKEFNLKVVNKPGELHEDLMKLDNEAVSMVFSAGKRLHGQFQSHTMYSDELIVSHSAGDGAWIMQKCAKTLGGACTIKFEKDCTVFSMTCPAVGLEFSKKHPQIAKFRMPPSTWGIAIDDSGIQRKLLDRFLSLAKIRKDRRMVLGKDATECLGFNDVVFNLMKENPEDKFLLVVDENLDIVDDGTHHRCMSGSTMVEKLRKRLGTIEEGRLLALVRSANDSGEDIALYKNRAHGFIPKAPIQKDRVLEMIAPLWEERFNDGLYTTDSDCDAEVHDTSAITTSSEDLMRTLEVIDALCMQGDLATLMARWPAIWDKLHLLKGDLKTLKSNARVKTVLEAIDELRGISLPEAFVERWRLVRALIVSLI